jgi:hypothetical protein
MNNVLENIKRNIKAMDTNKRIVLGLISISALVIFTMIIIVNNMTQDEYMELANKVNKNEYELSDELKNKRTKELKNMFTTITFQQFYFDGTKNIQNDIGTEKIVDTNGKVLVKIDANKYETFIKNSLSFKVKQAMNSDFSNILDEDQVDSIFESIKLKSIVINDLSNEKTFTIDCLNKNTQECFTNINIIESWSLGMNPKNTTENEITRSIAFVYDVSNFNYEYKANISMIDNIKYSVYKVLFFNENK